MSDVDWPPATEKKLGGVFSWGDVAGVSAAGCSGLVLALILGQVLVGLVVMVALLAVTLLSLGGVRVRVRFAHRVRWWLRRDRQWVAPLRSGRFQAPMFAGLSFTAFVQRGQEGSVGVVRSSRQQSCTVAISTRLPSTILAAPTEQQLAVRQWGEVLAELCRERFSAELAPTRVAWTDLHSAADPRAHVAFHDAHGVAGPLSADYATHVANFGRVAAAHEVLVTVTVTWSRVYRAAKSLRLSGSKEDQLAEAAVLAGADVASALRLRGYECELLNAAEWARKVMRALDPFGREPEPSNRERFGVPERTSPDSVEVTRGAVACDGAWHRSYYMQGPQTKVPVWWMQPVLATEGPKVVTTVFEPLAPSRADSDRDARRVTAKSASTWGSLQGMLRAKDTKKVAALTAADAAVAAGHQELDVYALVVLSARNVDGLDRRAAQLQAALRQAGRGQVRECTGVQDGGLVAALPLGVGAA